MVTRPRIAVAFDAGERWHERFATALAQQRAADAWFDFEVVNLDRHDWITQLAHFDAVLWKSSAMGAASSRFKEKIYFTETHLQKLVMPNFKTIWHFESKFAQSFVFEVEGVRTPKTFGSSDYDDAVAAIETWPPPYVFKLPEGAASQNVWLVETRKEARTFIDKTFANDAWKQATGSLRTLEARLRAATTNLSSGWLWQKVADVLLRRAPWKVVYWQEFVAGNPADLRITTIGGRYAAAFWRRNRPNDFRASGSGLIDYERPAPPHVVRACVELARKLDYDSMAFDILFRDDEFLIVEMSYGYVTRLVAQVPILFELRGDELITLPGKRWPQELWVECLLTKLRGRT